MKAIKKGTIFLLIISILLCSVPFNVIASDTTGEIDADVISDGLSIGEAGGYLEGAIVSTQRLYSEWCFTRPNGHGFAAEIANNLYDRRHGLNATVVGGDNVLNGADRRIINKDGNVIFIQDKYYSSALNSLNAAFDDNTTLYRYIDADGKPMVLEVPADQYDDVVLKMQEKIRNNKVPGVSDPNEAEKIVRKGKYTYQQAQNLTKAGNIDSLKYDAKNGVITAASALGITFVLDYVSCIINGLSPVDALEEAGKNALKTGAFVFATYVISSQIAKTGLTSALAPATDAIANALGEGLSKAILNTVGVDSVGLTSAQIAAKVSKVLQSQIIVEGVIIIALTIPDVIDLFKGRISTEQLLKNLTVTVLTAAGGAGGTIGGAAIGSAIAPGPGTVIGGIIGGILGSLGVGVLSEWAVSKFLEDDAEKMCEIIETEFQQLGEEYLITQEEADKIVEKLKEKLTGDCLKDMYGSDDREKFARDLMIPLFDNQLTQRTKIIVPSSENVREEMLKTMGEIVLIH